MSYSPSIPLSFHHAFAARTLLCALAGICLAIYWPVSHAQQPMMHGMADNSAIDVETMPHDDAVLSGPPGEIMLDFDEEVRLVKLTLRTPESRDLLDIGFRYDPAAGMMFTHRLPTLHEAPYYIADWAVVNEEERVIRGTFHFAFGPEARPPSEVMPEMEEMRHFMAPDYRLQDPEAEFRIQE
ncbi:MAG: copper resistance protein CopC [Pseudohongiellaceae bacterium]